MAKYFHALRKTATIFSTSTTNRRLSPSKSTGIAPLGLNRTLSYFFSGISGIFSTSAETATILPVIVGISMLSGSLIPPLVSFLSSSLRMRTLLPTGSTVSIGLDSIFFVSLSGLIKA